MLGLDPERSQMFWIVLVHYLRKALQIVTIARVSTMEDDAERVRVYPCTRLQHLINAKTCMEVQHLQVEMVSIVWGVYTTQCVERTTM